MKKSKPSNDKSFIEIDEFNLEKEWVGQPALYLKYAEKAAKARLNLDEADSELELVTADLDKAIRGDPEKYGLEKITESGIKITVPLQDEYQEALKAVNEARYELGIVQAAVNALDHRKRALEKLVDLWQGSYFSEPKSQGDAKEAMEEATKRTVRRRAIKR